MISVDRAKELAGDLLADALPRRWTHVQAVGWKAEGIGPWAVGQDAATLAVAAWLHDVGYAPTVAKTGFHPLDGARWLRSAGVDERITGLVAHHSCALLEAEERGLAEVLRAGAWPSRRSSPSRREAGTWRRAAADSQRR